MLQPVCGFGLGQRITIAFLMAASTGVLGCSGKTQQTGSSTSSPGSGAQPGTMDGSAAPASGGNDGLGAPPASNHHTNNPPPRADGTYDAATPSDPNKGDQILPPDDLAQRNAELQRAHDASAACIGACKVLDATCGESGFNHCDLSCPGPLAGDVKCAALVESAYTCLAEHVVDAIVCSPDGDPQVRCGICDQALATLAQNCDLKLECQF